MLASNPVTSNLIKARELIADEKNWCQGQMFGKHGSVCAIGAVSRVAPEDYVACDEILVDAAMQLFDTPDIIEVNDDYGHAAVMKLFDRAIELSLSTQGEAS